MPLYRVTTRFDGMAGAPYFNTLYFDDTEGSAQQAADAVATFWGGTDGVLSTSLSWAIDPEVPTINEVNGDIQLLSVVTPGSGTGGDGTEVGPTVLQALIQLRTGVPFDGRILRGRIFVPGLTVGVQDNGTLLAATAGTLQATADALIAELNAGLSIWHRPIPPPDADHPDRVQRDGAQADVSAASVATQFSVLRSRRE